VRYLLLSVFILFLGYLGVFTPIRDTSGVIFSPVQVGLRNFAGDIRGVTFFFTHLNALRRENISLREKVFSFESQILSLKEVALENQVLREQLAIKEVFNKDISLLLANVLGNPADLTGATVFVDKGTKHGVFVGANVIKGSYLVGKVIRVESSRSLVSLLNSPEISMAVLDVDTGDAIEGVVVGRHGLSLELTRVLPGESIRVGDTIVTSGKDGIFLPGLGVGTVTAIHEVPSEPLKSAQLKPLVDLSDLQQVFVILE